MEPAEKAGSGEITIAISRSILSNKRSKAARRMPDGLVAFGGTSSLSQSLTALPAPSGREPLARPQTLRFSRKLYRHAKGPISEDDFPRAGGRCRAATKRGIWHRAQRDDWGSFLGSAEGISIVLHPGAPGGAPCGAQHLFFRLGELFQGGFPAQSGALVRAAL